LSIRHHLDEEGREEVGQQVSRMRALTSDTQRADPMRAILGILLGRHTFVPLYSNRIEMRAHPQLSGICLDAYGWVDFSRVFVQP
jgi:MarR-like DNA-binding transcriptional regulator SgrR of sgrS sRNA